MKLPTGARVQISEELSNKKCSDLGVELAALHRELQETDRSMLVIVDGFESSGRGDLLKDLTKELDPKFYEVAVFEEEGWEDYGFPYLSRFIKNAPRRGQIMFFDRSFYYDLMREYEWDEEKLLHYIKDIQYIEELLSNDDTLIVKFFLHQTQKEMRKNIKALEDGGFSAVRLSEIDYKQMAEYDNYFKHFEKVLEATNHDVSPWHVLYIDGQKNTSRYALKLCIDYLQKYLVTNLTRPLPDLVSLPPADQLPLADVDYSASMTDAEYEDRLESLQKEAGQLLYRNYLEKGSIVIAYEGSDAAGKGGNIRRLTREMDPRGYDVSTTASPNGEERSHNYLWRFYRDFPRAGRMTIFDRSWYGRVLVERVEEITPEYRWREAYTEINQMEHNLHHQDILVLKYFLIIDRDEQLKRFIDRAENPLKEYKLTPEDWRNREKMDVYHEAMDEMLYRTSTEDAPWLIIPGTDKHYARIKVLEDFNRRVKEYLDHKKSQ